jgi:SNF2 family DNA or RNA helicase
MDLIIEEVLKKFSIKFMQLQGSDTSKQRVQVVDTFNSDPT